MEGMDGCKCFYFTTRSGLLCEAVTSADVSNGRTAELSSWRTAELPSWRAQTMLLSLPALKLGPRIPKLEREEEREATEHSEASSSSLCLGLKPMMSCTG